GNVIKTNKTDVVYEEGSDITLSCSQSPVASDYIYWYHQYERSKPEFLVLTFASAKEAQRSDVDPRFSVVVEKREQIHVDLKISSAAVSDSALYYCALSPCS
uniref:Ig-like domain-containing protein n=1 Tax=Sinocyclocheilus rhinocerous TaxID=307959 RepID=A0A673JSN4_9TELE